MGYVTLVGRSLGRSEVNWRDLVAFQGSAPYSEQLLLTEFSHFVIDDRLHTYAVPIFLLSGRFDRQSEASVARGFYEKVAAPRKEFVWFENSAHNPPFEEPMAFTQWISATIAPLGDRPQGSVSVPNPGR
jgi:pimeloyl-ACP methyl ester carboxylesterase